MKAKIIFLAFAASGLFFSSCEKEKVVTDKITFEDFVLDESGVFNGSDGSGGFTLGNAYFPNTFNEEWNYWERGFAISDHNDTETQGSANLYSCIAGAGAYRSSNFAIFTSWESDTITFMVPEKVTNISICNSTYAYYSMLYGDDFAKQFGGNSGDDPDLFKLKISCLNDNNEKWEIEINLADYTYVDNSKDYILNGWMDIDLSEVGFIKYMAFSFESTDTGDFGINTPAYVCIDNLFGELKE
ncbi:MAG: DUF4465 domain-containing protein [Bacteroidales bacterium]|nr:DUF4465 domain-containing protein [Bacteroidales bacterium]MCF8389520.1 DUF4465 domain-containing protein [Bacteroidales bacterium]